jgi:hypothetical protein
LNEEKHATDNIRIKDSMLREKRIPSANIEFLICLSKMMGFQRDIEDRIRTGRVILIIIDLDV